jgi:pSer/pThr/pTyr-binding forkhead associated (FHA) protein
MNMENTGAIPAVSSDTSPLPAIEDGHLEGLLGRSDDSNIVLDDVTVSRTHALILKDSSSWTIKDSGSLNGIYVNFIRIEDAKLSAGDDVQIGKYRFTFLLPEQQI